MTKKDLAVIRAIGPQFDELQALARQAKEQSEIRLDIERQMKEILDQIPQLRRLRLRIALLKSMKDNHV